MGGGEDNEEEEGKEKARGWEGNGRKGEPSDCFVHVYAPGRVSLGSTTLFRRSL